MSSAEHPALETFSTSRPLTLGVELELQIVNRTDYETRISR